MKSIKHELDEKLIKVQQEVSKRIETEFEDKQIKNLISTIASERVHSVADELIRKEIEQKIEPLREELKTLTTKNTAYIDTNIKLLQDKLNKTNATEAELESSLKTAKNLLAILDSQSNFMTAFIKAMTGDRIAYNQIEKTLKTPDSKLNIEAFIR